MGAPSRFKWSERKEQAAMLVARDELTDEEIAKTVGLTRHGLSKWKRLPMFQERVEELTDALAEAIKGRGIADLENRVDALNERWNGMRRLIDERAARYAEVPGGVSTGLLKPRSRAARRKPAGSGKPGGASQPAVSMSPEDYVLDSSLLRELRKHEKQAAQELGQWNRAPEPEPRPGALIREYVGVDVDDV